MTLPLARRTSNVAASRLRQLPAGKDGALMTGETRAGELGDSALAAGTQDAHHGLDFAQISVSTTAMSKSTIVLSVYCTRSSRGHGPATDPIMLSLIVAPAYL